MAPGKRRAFSLMEVVIVLLLVAVIGGVTSYSLLPFYRDYRFGAQVDALYDLIQEIQLEAMTLQSDIQVRLYREGGKWKATSQSEESILKPQSVDLSQTEKVLQGTHPIEQGVITFYANGLIQPKDVVTFSRRNMKRGLDLRCPPLIKVWTKEPPKAKSHKLPNLKKMKEVR